eukprot:3141435-Alexandrium_andersonii.AAC.1
MQVDADSGDSKFSSEGGHDGIDQLFCDPGSSVSALQPPTACPVQHALAGPLSAGRPLSRGLSQRLR